MARRDHEQNLSDAALHALGALPPDECAAFEEELAGSEELRAELAAFDAVAQQLALLAPPVAPRPATRARLLERVARVQDAAAHAGAKAPALFFLRDLEAPWVEVGPGVASKLLTPGAQIGERVRLFRVEPGGRIRDHDHPVVEHCYVLTGDFHVGDECLGPGDYHRAAAGTHHRELGSTSGCLFLVVDGPAA